MEWAHFHSFRHTVASELFDAGRNPVQVQHWLGHHSVAFTMSTYVHLLDSKDLGGPMETRVVQPSVTEADAVHTKCTHDPRCWTAITIF